MSEEMPATVEALREANAELQQEIETLRERQREQMDRLANHARVKEVQIQISDTQREAFARIVKAHAETAEVDQASESDEFYRDTLRYAFTIGKLLGYRSESERLAFELNAQEIYRELADIETPETDGERYAKILDLVKRATRWGSAEKHPSAPEYRDLWRNAFVTAKRLNLCEEFERVAGYLGIPTDYEVNWSGTVRVELSGVVYVEASGTGDSGEPDPWEYAEDFHPSDIQWETESAEWTDYNIED